MSRKDFCVVVGFSLMLQGCAGSPPDYSPRTASFAQEEKLSRFFETAQEPERNTAIVAPICSSTAGTAATGWAIDAGNWCVVPCMDNTPGEDRWVTDTQGNRCLATENRQPTRPVTVEFGWNDLSLNQPALFSGFAKSFLSDTEWACREYRYRIDPEKSLGFWDELTDQSFVYRFHRDGRLVMGGGGGGAAKPSGTWSVRGKDQVFFNARRVFEHAIDYGGGRFDDFISATRKQVCRFVQEADPLAAVPQN